MKLLRRLLIVAVLLLAVLVAAAALLPRLLDSNVLRSMLVVAVRNHTGRELTVEGDIRFALLPRPAVVLPRLSLADAVGFGPEPFASMDGARLNLRLWPLLWRRLAVASVRIDRPQLRLKVDAVGRGNWADLLPPSEPALAGPSTDKGLGSTLAGRVGVGQLMLRDADLLWSDQRSGRWARVHGLDLDLDGLDPVGPMPVIATATVDVGDPVRSAQLEVATTLQRGADGVWQGPDLRIDSKLAATSQRDALALHLTAAASFDPAQTRLRLQQLALDAKPLQLRGELTVARSGDTPVVGAQVRLERLDARTLAAQLGQALTLANAGALSSISGNLELSANAREVNLARIDLNVDGSAWHGNARIRLADKPVVRFALEGDHLDLDHYLPADQAPGAKSAVANPSASAPAPAVTGSPADALRRLTKVDLDGTLNLATLRVRGLVLERVALRARGGAGRLVLEPLNTSLYGGALDASLQAEARGREPTLYLKLAATDVAAGPFLTALTGRDAVQGRFTVAGEMTGAAATGEALLRSLNGTLRLNGSDGVLKGINADRSICQARALIAKARDKEATDCDPSPDTRFSALRMGGPLAAGVWRSDDLFLEQQRYRPGRFYRLTGAGTLDLATGKADYLLKATAVRRGGEAADPEIRESLVPVRVRGQPGEWHLKPEPGDRMRDEALRKLQDKLGPDGNNGRESRGKSLLRGLLGR
ncbi:AsmA family protein [Immundisolibacter sp.]